MEIEKNDLGLEKRISNLEQRVSKMNDSLHDFHLSQQQQFAELKKLLLDFAGSAGICLPLSPSVKIPSSTTIFPTSESTNTVKLPTPPSPPTYPKPASATTGEHVTKHMQPPSHKNQALIPAATAAKKIKEILTQPPICSVQVFYLYNRNPSKYNHQFKFGPISHTLVFFRAQSYPTSPLAHKESIQTQYPNSLPPPYTMSCHRPPPAPPNELLLLPIRPPPAPSYQNFVPSPQLQSTSCHLIWSIFHSKTIKSNKKPEELISKDIEQQVVLFVIGAIKMCSWQAMKDKAIQFQLLTRFSSWGDLQFLQYWLGTDVQYHLIANENLCFQVLLVLKYVVATWWIVLFRLYGRVWTPKNDCFRWPTETNKLGVHYLAVLEVFFLSMVVSR